MPGIVGPSCLPSFDLHVTLSVQHTFLYVYRCRVVVIVGQGFSGFDSGAARALSLLLHVERQTSQPSKVSLGPRLCQPVMVWGLDLSIEQLCAFSLPGVPLTVFMSCYGIYHARSAGSNSMHNHSIAVQVRT